MTSVGSTELPAIGIVLIGRNEGDRLRQCLDSLAAVNYPADLLETVYVDSASSDGSVELARSMGVQVVELDGPTTAARARNAGWTTLSTPFVLFLDGDTILHREFLRKAVQAIALEGIAGVFGNRRESQSQISAYNAVYDLDWPKSEGDAEYFGGDALVRVEALQRVGGYDATLIAGEEPDMCRRMRALGYRIVHIDEAMTLHDLAMHRFQQYWRRSLRTGYAYAEVSSRYWDSDDPLWRAQAERNMVRGTLWMIVPALAFLIAAAVGRPSIFLIVTVLAGGLLFRGALRARSLGASWFVSAAYGIHSQLQHVPILFGQMRYWRHRRKHRAGVLIEYK